MAVVIQSTCAIQQTTWEPWGFEGSQAMFVCICRIVVRSKHGKRSEDGYGWERKWKWKWKWKVYCGKEV